MNTARKICCFISFLLLPNLLTSSDNSNIVNEFIYEPNGEFDRAKRRPPLNSARKILQESLTLQLESFCMLTSTLNLSEQDLTFFYIYQALCWNQNTELNSLLVLFYSYKSYFILQIVIMDQFALLRWRWYLLVKKWSFFSFSEKNFFLKIW